ncbi:hypothetical protein Y032_0384g402 [Ancylostoma ceylanicum]|uniref:Uncharacterized protein n=1 Tax=Ancylostoma ceylanicum TaxID=53326 RepID=A0A016RSV6_9BILA|nr:hypothetical protein Y032_0384g402 [Ancylostoma ceylanicum]
MGNSNNASGPKTTPPSPLPDDECQPSTSHSADPSDEITPHSSQSSAFTKTRGSASTSTTPRIRDSADSDETVLEMDTHRLSQIEDSVDNTPEGSTSSIVKAEFKQYLRDGTDWPLDEASTSSAPPTINRESLNAKQSLRNALERKVLLKEMRNRDGKEARRTLRSKDRGRLMSDISADEKPNSDRWHGLNHRGKLRPRPLARRDSRDAFRIRRRHGSGNVRKSTD